MGNLGRLEEAIASYQHVLSIEPEDTDAMYGLACAYALQGHRDQAVDYLRKSINLDPNKYIDLARQDDDLQSLHKDPRFVALIN